MAAIYPITVPRWITNRLITALLRFGLAPRRYHMLTVRGRKSGRLYSTPVFVIEDGGQRWLVAPYGQREWVKNARAAGQVVLSRARYSETVAVREELEPVQSGRVLKQYLAEQPRTRRFFDVTPQSSLEEFVQEAPRHPVFRIIEASEQGA